MEALVLYVFQELEEPCLCFLKVQLEEKQGQWLGQ